MYLKLKEFTKEKLEEQYNNGTIDLDFIFDYIVKINHVYNKLIDELNRLEK